MNEKILVTYATQTGSTAGVAEAISKKIAESGVSVVLMPMRDVTDLSPYTAVVAGSAIHGKEWLPEAKQFMLMHYKEMQKKPFAAFLVCMTLAMKQGEKYRPYVASFLDPVRVQVKPVSEGLFAGALFLDKLPFGTRIKFAISVMLGVWQKGDHRDWRAIDEWASTLPALLH